MASIDYFYVIGDSEQSWPWICQKADGTVFSLVGHTAKIRVLKVEDEEIVDAWNEFDAQVGVAANGEMKFSPALATNIDDQGIYYVAWIAVRTEDGVRLTFPDDLGRLTAWVTKNA